MSLRVLDDARPGFALLAFGGSLDHTSLSISVRSLRENAFLGPDGKWQKAPHFFAAERMSDDAATTLYRVGPEIVNHLLEHDRIEIASADGTLREEALWENAVPQMLGQSLHSIYRPANVVAGEARVKAPLRLKSRDETPPSPPEPILEQPPAPQESPPPQPQPVVPPVVPPRSRLLPLIIVAALAVIALAAVAALFRCSLFGVSCPAPPVVVDQTLDRTMACAASQQPCEIRGCFADYLAKTPPDKIAAAARDALSNADRLCATAQENARIERDKVEKDKNAAAARRAAENRVLQSARQCAAGAGDCVVKSCYSAYLRDYGSAGAFSSQARAEAAAADARCQRSQVVTPPATSIADGAYNAGTLRSCGAAAQFGIRVTIKAGAISWEHELRGTRYTWSGTIDAQGNIRASVGNSRSFTASGRYSDSERDVQMQYPQCGSETITLSIIGRL